jgi:hypothetical protein
MILAAIVIFLLALALMGAAMRQVASAVGGLIFIGVLVAAWGWPVLAVAAVALLWAAAVDHSAA